MLGTNKSEEPTFISSRMKRGSRRGRRRRGRRKRRRRRGRRKRRYKVLEGSYST